MTDMKTDNVETLAFGGTMTPKQTLLDALEISDEMQFVCVVFSDHDGGLRTGWSSGGDLLARIGMIEIAKAQLIETTMVPEAL